MIQSDEHQHHTIWTPELVEIHLPLAGVARRCMAMLVDQVIVGILNIGAVIVAIILLTMISPLISDTTDPALFFTLLIGLVLFSILLYFLYFWGFHTFNNGQTLGKMWLGIRLVTDRGGRPSGWTCFARTLFDLLDVMLFYGSIAVLMILMTEREKRIADFAAGTIVIKDR